jgi:CheY-like chemotaxis protein
MSDTNRTKKILLVEDSDDAATISIVLAQQYGYKMPRVPNLPMAIFALKPNLLHRQQSMLPMSYDAVLLDVALPSVIDMEVYGEDAPRTYNHPQGRNGLEYFIQEYKHGRDLYDYYKEGRIGFYTAYSNTICADLEPENIDMSKIHIFDKNASYLNIAIHQWVSQLPSI